MRVATWNINNVNKRVDLLVDWLNRTKPDVVALQELKCLASDFPSAALEAAGYSSVVVGQRTWNGVAILSRNHEPLPVVTTLPGDPTDKEARYVEAAINGILFACLYLPNGNPWPGTKFDYKLRWFERLKLRAQELLQSGFLVVMLGDWNVVPTDADIYKPDTWLDNALLQPEPRRAYAEILAQGWTDAIAHVHAKNIPFTFWDYRRKRWERNAGLRIDHILVNANFKVLDSGVDREERGKEGPSDHAPVWAELELKKSTTPRKGRAAKETAPLPAPKGIPAWAKSSEPLATYNAKRNFSKTAEPAGVVAAKHSRRKADPSDPLQFVIQKHWASHLHYDFRLELDGVMVSWAVPKGPSYDPAVKSMAIHVEDHPIGYNEFEGDIPKGEYGAGSVIVWDRGIWEAVGDPHEGLAKGKILFKLHGQKLAGLWELVRISKPGQKKQDQWMLFKKRGDAWARPSSDYNVITALPDSVVEMPLGLIEDREPRDPGAAQSRNASPTGDPLQAAKKASLPVKLEPQLATLVSNVPDGDWVIETKYDGYRMLARVEGDKVRLFSRNGNDWTKKLQHIADAVAAFGLTSAWLDGEIVVLNDAGIPDFNRLQNSIDSAQPRDILMFVFDIPFLGDMDLRAVPLLGRRAVLKDLFDERQSSIVRFSPSFDVSPSRLLGAACQMGLEGLMAKQAEAPYVSGRTETWVKLKCQHRQEFVVLGFTDRSGASKEVGSLLLGYYEDGQLHHAGSVGTGWDSSTAGELHLKLADLEVATPAVSAAQVKPSRWSKRKAGSERWVKPSMVVEISFAEWTRDKRIRHAVFRGIRTDKPANAIVRERAKEPAAVALPAAQPKPKRSALNITHPDRVLDPSTGLRKIDLIRYYESIAERMLPHLKNRPVSLVRAPTGITGELFFQKHSESKMPGMKELDPGLWPDHAALLAVDSTQALVSAAQMNVVEFHTWNSKVARIDKPDRFILDLDPGEGVTWPMLQEAAELTRVMLTELGLESWLKTSGGKGLHVVVPITPKLSYAEVKDFSHAVVKHMAKVIPSKFVAVMGGKNRVGKIFIDYLRNGHGQTTACAFTARSRPGMGVSMPVDWAQLRELKGGAQWTIATARDYLSFQKEDPWKDYWKKKQSIHMGMRLLQ